MVGETRGQETRETRGQGSCFILKQDPCPRVSPRFLGFNHWRYFSLHLSNICVKCQIEQLLDILK